MGRLKELFLIHGVYPVSDLLFHTHVSRWFSRIKRMLVWRPEQISDWQTQRMRELVANAYQYSPYYRQLFDSLSLKPEDIRTVGDLEKIPPLTKEIIRVLVFRLQNARFSLIGKHFRYSKRCARKSVI